MNMLSPGILLFRFKEESRNRGKSAIRANHLRLLWKSITRVILYSLIFPAAANAQTKLPAEVQEIFDVSCAVSGCHVSPSPAGDLDLSEKAAFSELVNVRSSANSQMIRVTPGAPHKSYLMAKLLDSQGMQGKVMPPGGERLSNSELRAIVSWIKSMSGKSEAPKKAWNGNESYVDESPRISSPKKRPPQTFPGWSAANLPTTNTVPKGGFMYRVGHKFAGQVSSGIDRFFGLDDGAFMMTQVGFPLSNRLSLTFARSAEDATIEAGAKFRLISENWGLPVSAALNAGVDWSSTAIIPDPLNINQNTGRLDGERFAFFAQLPVSKRLGRFSLLTVPGILLNGNARLAGEAPLITLGLVGRASLSKKYGFFVEYIPMLSGAGDAATVGLSPIDNVVSVINESFTAGFEIHLGGHVFHIFVTNTLGNTTNQYLSGGNFNFAQGEMRLGFNVFRTMNYPF